MKKNKKIILGIILLIVLAIAFIIIMINNPNISTIKQKENKEQLTTEDGFISTREHLNEIASTKEETKAKLLWTNSNPTSAFPAQTLYIDLANYDAIIIDVGYVSTYITNYRTIQVFPKTGETYNMLNGFYGANGSWVRTVTVNEDSIIFGSCQQNNGTYPLAIYGVKGITSYHAI